MLSKVCFEPKIARRAPSFPLKGNRRVKTLRRLSKSKMSEEIMLMGEKMRSRGRLTRERSKFKSFEH
jgi:hypothetical protein